MAKINNLFSRLTRAQFNAQIEGEGFEKHCIVFISDEKKIWNNDVFYGLSEEDEKAILLYQSKLDDNLTTPEAHGGLPAGSKVSDLKTKSLSEIFDAILFPVIQPTVTPPSVSITPKGSWANNGIYEVGAAAPQSDNFTVSFNKGKATCPGQPQLDRAGEESSRKITHNDSDSLPANITLGQMNYVATIEYAQGPELKNSHGNKATTAPNPLPAGNTSATAKIFGTYPYFCNGASASSSNQDTNFPSKPAPDTKLPLIKWTDALIGAKFASETGGTRFEFLFPSQKKLSKVEFMNTVSGKWEVFGTDKYTTEEAGTKKVQSSQIAYTKFTTTGAFLGALQLRFTLANSGRMVEPYTYEGSEITEEVISRLAANSVIAPLSTDGPVVFAAASTGNRAKGVADFAVNFEPGGQAPLDARTMVPTKADLIAPETYSGKNYYKSMPVFVLADESAKGEVTLYTLIDPDKITKADYSGWKRIDVGNANAVINVINDLTTGGADKALSAEQGKVLKGFIDALQANTINGKKISKNPVLSGADIALTGYVKSVLETAELAIAAEDTVNVAIGKLEKRADDADAKLTSELAKKVDKASINEANGVAGLNENGKIPESLLDGTLGRVQGIQKFLATQAELTTDPDASKAKEGDQYYCEDTKKIYTKTSDGWDEGRDPAADTIYNHRLKDKEGRTNVIYRWDGSTMVELSESVALGEVTGTAYDGGKGAANRGAITSMPAKMVSSVDAPTADADKVTFNYKAASRNEDGLKYNAEATATVEIPAATQSAAGVMKAIDKKNLDILVTIMGGTPEDPESPVNPNTADFLKKSDAGIGVLKDYATAGKPAAVAAGDTIAVAFGKIVKALDTITGGTDGSIPEEGSKVDNYTVNGYKISTNPILNGGDIALTGFSETPDAKPVNENNIKTTDTVNAALKKAQNRVEALEALLEWYEGK